MFKTFLFGSLALLGWSHCRAQGVADLPDSLAASSRIFHFTINNDSLYQQLKVSRYDDHSIRFDLYVHVRDATWSDDTLRLDGVLKWSGTYGVATTAPDSGKEETIFDEWCFSGPQIEICIHGRTLETATINYLAPAPIRMERR